jgi:hypothetical protein
MFNVFNINKSYFNFYIFIFMYLDTLIYFISLIKKLINNVY